LPAAGASSFVGWAKPLAAVDEIALAIGRAEVDGRERRIEVDRIIDIVTVYVMVYRWSTKQSV